MRDNAVKIRLIIRDGIFVEGFGCHVCLYTVLNIRINKQRLPHRPVDVLVNVRTSNLQHNNESQSQSIS